MPSEWCDGFLKLVKDGEPIEGESTDDKFPGLIEIVSFQFGSSQGFPDKEGLYAAQDANLRHGVARGRFNDDGAAGIASLFGDEPSAPQEFDEGELKDLEGTDLAEVDACKITITKELDLSSPDLFRAYCSTQDLNNRDVFESATLYVKKATGGNRKVFLTFVFSDVVVTGYTLDIGGDAIPKETINLVFAKCRVEYKPQQEPGGLEPAAIKGGWDMIERGAW
ncbi:MAG TPA: type VI secretion system tube protein Hcp [Pirellulales bacterium]|jgi:type VI protein secretion system component Hcp|nr:type VI secretion system tube protein Hcp [Pirellulales bacterium]